MNLLIVGFLASALLTLGVIVSSGIHGKLSADSDFAGPKKFHTAAVPRIGGLGIFVAVVLGAPIVGLGNGFADSHDSWLLLA